MAARRKKKPAKRKSPSKRRAASQKAHPAVVYIHGIAQSEAAPTVKRRWDEALFGGGMAGVTRLAWWADLVGQEPVEGRTRALAVGVHSHAKLEPFVADVVASLPTGCDAAAHDYVASFARRLSAGATRGASSKGRAGPRTKALPLPAFLRRPLANLLFRLLLRDSAAYFYDAEVRDATRERLSKLLLERRGERVLLVAHSFGSVVAYDVLHALGRKLSDVSWITLGSPLGVREVQDQIHTPLRVPSCVKSWLNVTDPLDFVALDKGLANDFASTGSRPRVRDESVRNSARPQNPHSASGYLATHVVRNETRRVIGSAFAGTLPQNVINRDVAASMNEDDEWRIPVLIELHDGATKSGEDADAPLDRLAERGQRIATELERLSGGTEDAEIDVLKRFVAASLLPAELHELSVSHSDLGVHRIWSNSTKRKLTHRSLATIHVDAARNAYAAHGEKIQWAVLDTGIEPRHGHFAKHANIREVWDCTEVGKPRRRGSSRRTASRGLDRDGHGTHVAGIVAGEGTDGKRVYTGMAPRAGIHSFKVLGDDGSGRDSSIIKALETISELNESHSRLVIHGVNLSLGGPFDPWVYAVGFSPICRELRRLWQQGVLVVVAAGNEGEVTLATSDGDLALNADLSIGDPANLEECIAVGSVHKSKPQSFGVSHFSSKGPTADGRAKPDVVAPGERILSADALFVDEGTRYVELSGTSMACPHVSGLLAAFLSVRREYIGRPDAVKELLLASCSDLGRDRYIQGAGVPNLLKMLSSA